MYHDLRGLSIDPVQLQLDKKAPNESPEFTGRTTCDDVHSDTLTVAGNTSANGNLSIGWRLGATRIDIKPDGRR